MREMACPAGRFGYHSYKVLITQQLSRKLGQIMTILNLLQI